jgi:hypothetical protein
VEGDTERNVGYFHRKGAAHQWYLGASGGILSAATCGCLRRVVINEVIKNRLMRLLCKYGVVGLQAVFGEKCLSPLKELAVSCEDTIRALNAVPEGLDI